jgi:N-acyl amino acid synthase of PEP-CTERM/exosortase system
MGVAMQMLSLREQIRQAECAFSVIIADEPELVEAACRLRYQVYCLERGFEPGSNGIETDEFDRNARHVLLVHRQTGETIGTARVIPSSGTHGVSGLPMNRVCAPELLRHLPSRTTGEISRSLFPSTGASVLALQRWCALA